MLKEKTRKAMQPVSDKITEFCKLEKRAWGDLDGIEVKVSEMIQEVEEITPIQVRYVSHSRLCL